ncbi:RibD family protein [Mucilaginibacter terrae]|uniref:Riboflavin biosynthesis pyrimidine reductase n=1 Tax=Mucilaginibacter terrae TaxID=1955052 RepID=A0ABU3GX36_9SPHI|nr:RibD family protein [Mucilaginibacter terrae]MDT3404324.1 riboflavin biosynthesis pyrimidine reductase [Mucilaginibacter terrae]
MAAKRPYVICLMMTSVDGKILSEKWGDSAQVKKLAGTFEKIHEEIGIGAWIVGRTTMEKDFTEFAKPVLKKGHHEVDKNDFVADYGDTDTFAIAIDGQGKLGWHEPLMQGDHVITILTEAVPDAYLAHLQDIGVSYIFAGKKEVDLNTALEKLYKHFGIEKLMLEGGAHINGSFLNEGLVDELYQLLLPIADGTIETSTLFEIDPKAKKGGATLLKLDNVKHIEDDVLWLTYKVKN